MTEESFADWIEKHADSVVDEVLKTAADTKKNPHNKTKTKQLYTTKTKI